MTGNIILAIVILILLLAAAVIVRTCMLQPTSAMTAKVELQENERARGYGEALAKMIRKETVSSRFDTDKTKFYEFHEILEELFPLVHKRSMNSTAACFLNGAAGERRIPSSS